MRDPYQASSSIWIGICKSLFELKIQLSFFASRSCLFASSQLVLPTEFVLYESEKKTENMKRNSVLKARRGLRNLFCINKSFSCVLRRLFILNLQRTSERRLDKRSNEFLSFRWGKVLRKCREVERKPWNGIFNFMIYFRSNREELKP